MTQTFRVRYDGSVLVPESPLICHGMNRSSYRSKRLRRRHGTAAFLMRERKGRGIDDADAERMKAAIEEACERTSTDL